MKEYSVVSHVDNLFVLGDYDGTKRAYTDIRTFKVVHQWEEGETTHYLVEDQVKEEAGLLLSDHSFDYRYCPCPIGEELHGRRVDGGHWKEIPIEACKTIEAIHSVLHYDSDEDEKKMVAGALGLTLALKALEAGEDRIPFYWRVADLIPYEICDLTNTAYGSFYDAIQQHS